MVMQIAVISGSVFGAAHFHAQNVSKQLKKAGFKSLHLPDPELSQVLAINADFYVFVSSTTGLGELPPSLMPLYQDLRDNLPLKMRGKDCVIIGLGDSCYDDFCNAANLLSELSTELGMQELMPPLKLDACAIELDASVLVKDFIDNLITKIVQTAN